MNLFHFVCREAQNHRLGIDLQAHTKNSIVLPLQTSFWLILNPRGICQGSKASFLPGLEELVQGFEVYFWPQPSNNLFVSR